LPLRLAALQPRQFGLQTRNVRRLLLRAELGPRQLGRHLIVVRPGRGSLGSWCRGLQRRGSQRDCDSCAHPAARCSTPACPSPSPPGRPALGLGSGCFTRSPAGQRHVVSLLGRRQRRAHSAPARQSDPQDGRAAGRHDGTRVGATGRPPSPHRQKPPGDVLNRSTAGQSPGGVTFRATAATGRETPLCASQTPRSTRGQAARLAPATGRPPPPHRQTPPRSASGGCWPRAAWQGKEGPWTPAHQAAVVENGFPPPPPLLRAGTAHTRSSLSRVRGVHASACRH